MCDVSIIIPVYNSEFYIKRCLDSVANIKNAEIIVINDGSTDNTLEILKGYKNIKIINNENYGVSHSRNCGIKEATGKYIMFVDSDDYLNTDMNIYDLKTMNFDIIYFNKNLTNIKSKESLYEYVCGLKHPIIAGPYCKLFKREFIQENQIFFDENIVNGEDMLFNINCLNKVKKFKIIDKNIYMYRQVIGTATKKFDKKIIESDLNFHMVLKKLLNESELRDDEKNKIITYSILNGIITLTDRMSYINDYKEFKVNILCIENEPYCLLHKINLLNSSINGKLKIILFLLKLKFYRFVYLLFRKKHSKYVNDEEKFIEI